MASDQVIDATGPVLRGMKDVPASFRLAGFALLRTRRGAITFVLPDGRKVRFANELPGADAQVIVHDYAFARRALAGGDVGFAESYMDSEWSTPDLTEVLRFFSDNFESAGKLAVGGSIVRALNKFRHLFNRNSKSGAKRNIAAHYDLGNAFYASWLDASMTYSSALFDGNDNLSLEQAQKAKYARITDELAVSPDSRLLEIGCGWGGFAEYAAKHRGAHVTCLTISQAQQEFAQQLMQAEGLSDRVDIRLEDYRDHKGLYDGVASIEMFEAVGEAYWPSYFEKVRDTLKENARAAIQIITIQDDLFDRYRKRADFIQRYIFPGGMLGAETPLKQQFAAAGLSYEGVKYFGRDYATTLRLWAQRFEAAWDEIVALGFDERFRRLWRFYLSYCEAGFDSGRINVGQFRLSRA